MGTFVFRWPYTAKDVHVTGTFDDWTKSEQLNRVGDHWEKEVRLPSADKKIYYKFVVDDEWIVDQNAPKEEDGHNNINNFLLPEQIKKIAASVPLAPSQSAGQGHRVIATSSSPPGSHALGAPTEAPTVSAPTDSAPTLTKEESEANAARWVPHVVPDPNRPVTRAVAPTGAAGTGAAAAETSGAAAPATEVPGAFPEDGQDNFRVAPLPATGHSDIQSSVTTSKEDYERLGGEGTAGGNFTAQPIPATGHDDIQSSVTTSKEAYEKAGILGAAGAAIAGAGAAVASAFSKPKSDDKNIIPESSLPMNPEKTDTMDQGPFVNSSGPGTTTADLASNVPLEPKREAQVIGSDAPASAATGAAPFISSSGPGTTTAALASQVPLEQKRQGVVVDSGESPAAAVPEQVKESIESSNQSPEAAASPAAVAEKSALEKELTSKVPESQASGAPASAAATQSSYYGLATTVPATVEESMKDAHASPEAAADPALVSEKSNLERELAAKVPKSESAGEPAPTLAAATSTSAPTATTTTDGTTATKEIAGTDTSTASRGATAGEVAGGALVGGAAAVGAAALAERHKGAGAESSAGTGTAKSTTDHIPGTSSTAAAQVADGAGIASPDEVPASTKAVPVEKSEGATTEYAPPRDAAIAPGVSSSAAAALSDGTEDPTLAEEPAVKMMAQNEAEHAAPSATLSSKNDIADAGAASTARSDDAKTTDKKDTSTSAPVGVAATSSKAPETPKKEAAATKSTTSTPAKSETGASTTEDGKKKKRHRISGFFKKIFD